MWLSINGFDPMTGALDDPKGNQITKQGLWDITIGNGGAARTFGISPLVFLVPSRSKTEDFWQHRYYSRARHSHPAGQRTRKLDRLRLALGETHSLNDLELRTLADTDARVHSITTLLSCSP